MHPANSESVWTPRFLLLTYRILYCLGYRRYQVGHAHPARVAAFCMTHGGGALLPHHQMFWFALHQMMSQKRIKKTRTLLFK